MKRFIADMRMALHPFPPVSTHHPDSPVLYDMQQLSLGVSPPARQAPVCRLTRVALALNQAPLRP